MIWYHVVYILSIKINNEILVHKCSFEYDQDEKYGVSEIQFLSREEKEKMIQGILDGWYKNKRKDDEKRRET